MELKMALLQCVATGRRCGLMLLTGLLMILSLAGCGSELPRTEGRRVVLLGFDGVDPDLVRQWIDELPNIRSLSQSGTLSDLGSTNPPESPVAWASFATGMNPGKHGIFDFLTRDPETYFPDIGLVQRRKPEFLFGAIPIKGPRVINNRKGRPFWQVLDEHGHQTLNLRMPLEFPPLELQHGRTLSGLGLPDIRGTWGTYFYLASDLSQWDLGDTEFGGRQIQLKLQDNRAEVELDGPVDPRSDDFSRISIPLHFELDEAGTEVTIRVQGQQQTVQERKWSDWFRFEYSIGPFVSIRGISRFFVLETFPELRVYLMPISIHPEDPPIAFTTPADYSSQLMDRFGLFKSVGWVHETWGLNEEQIDEAVFLEDLFRNVDTLEGILLDELDQRQASLYSTIFTATDSVAHMFYRLLDPEHPRYESVLAERFGDAVLRVYRRMDEVIGKVQAKLDDDDVLLVLSDHGFHSWRKEFNTNTWLVRNGFMTLKGMDSDTDLRKLDQMFSGGSFFPNVDWSRTRAYAVGLSQIYINKVGRESQGIVTDEQYLPLIEEIRSKILEYVDPDNDQRVLENAYYRGEIYDGAEVDHAGDIVISFKSGYRTSWQTSLGAVPENILVANLKKWSGDHCASDITQTSGFFVSNLKLEETSPSIVDIAPTLYRLFDVEIPSEVDGRPLTLR